MKKVVAFLTAAAVSLSFPVTVLAGQWVQDQNGWWWRNDDGTWPANKWEWIDADQNGIAECYYFNVNGYLLMNTKTPDGYTVDASGAWVENGTVQTKTVSISPTPAADVATTTVTAAEEALREAGRISNQEDNWEQRQTALNNYFKALGYDPSKLTITDTGVSYRQSRLLAAEPDPFYDLLNTKDDISGFDIMSLAEHFVVAYYTYSQSEGRDMKLSVAGLEDTDGDNYASVLIRAVNAAREVGQP